MTSGLASVPELADRLRRAGVDVGSAVVTLDVSARVVAELRSHPARRRRWPAFAAVVAALAATTTLAIPPARAGVARWLGVGAGAVDVRIEPFPGELPPPIPADTSSTPGSQLFGTPVSASEATARTGLPLPAPNVLGPPDALYVDAAGRRIIVVYAPSADLPDGEVEGVGAIVEVIRATYDRLLYAKSIRPGDATETEVDGGSALFLDAPHPLSYLDETGTVITETARLAGKTLMWGREGVVFRLESELDLESAVTLAESIP